MNNNGPKFEVAAGRFDWNGDRACEERDYKYIDSFDTIEEAEVALESCRGYDFIDLMYVTVDGRRFPIQY